MLWNEIICPLVKQTNIVNVYLLTLNNSFAVACTNSQVTALPLPSLHMDILTLRMDVLDMMWYVIFLFSKFADVQKWYAEFKFPC